MRILLTALALLIVYQVAIVSGVIPTGIGRDNAELNYITSERWRYKSAVPKVMIVGSSKTNFLDYEVLGPHVSHMGFGAQGCLTGLEILNKSTQLPKLLLVEIDETLEWPADKNCVALATEKFNTADIIKPMQHRFEPCAIFLLALNSLLPQNVPSPGTRKHFIAIQEKNLAIPLRTDKRATFTENVLTTQSLIEALKKKGVTVVLFSIPLEQQLQDSQYINEVSAFLDSYFASQHATILTYPTTQTELHTRDGYHLLPESGRTFSAWLNGVIQQNLSTIEHL